MKDVYGRVRALQEFNLTDAPKPYEIETIVTGDTEVKYTRFFDRGDKACAIWKQTYVKDTNDTVISYKHEFAFAPWASRAGAEYVPINDCWSL